MIKNDFKNYKNNELHISWLADLGLNKIKKEEAASLKRFLLPASVQTGNTHPVRLSARPLFLGNISVSELGWFDLPRFRTPGSAGGGITGMCGRGGTWNHQQFH